MEAIDYIVPGINPQTGETFFCVTRRPHVEHIPSYLTLQSIPLPYGTFYATQEGAATISAQRIQTAFKDIREGRTGFFSGREGVAWDIGDMIIAKQFSNTPVDQVIDRGVNMELLRLIFESHPELGMHVPKTLGVLDINPDSRTKHTTILLTKKAPGVTLLEYSRSYDLQKQTSVAYVQVLDKLRNAISTVKTLVDKGVLSKFDQGIFDNALENIFIHFPDKNNPAEFELWFIDQ